MGRGDIMFWAVGALGLAWVVGLLALLIGLVRLVWGLV